MSGFCVFGVTMEDCIERARKKIRVKRGMTVDEHTAKAEILAKEMFVACRGASKLALHSTRLNSLEIGLKSHKKTIEAHSIKIMCRGEKVDDKGNPVLRKGAPVIGWTQYKQG